MDKNPKKIEDVIDENLDKLFHVDENEIDELIKQAELDAKEGKFEEKKETKKKKKKKDKKDKKDKKEEEEDKEMEEFRKWKAQKEKEEKNKNKKKSKKEKEDSNDDESEEKEEENDKESDENENENEETFGIDDFPPKILNKINKKDLRIVLAAIEKCDMKYSEGLDLIEEEDYTFALDYFKNANSSYLALNKLVQSKKDIYPSEFRNIVSSKINEKIKLVHQTAKKCSKLRKEKYKKDILSSNKNNNNITNYNYNINFQNNANNPQAQKNIHNEEEEAMDKKIESEIMVKNPKVKFSDIIGMQEMKQTLYEIIVVPTIRPDLFT